ncbi:hypothetical protein RhiJN_16169 [Ceratobasidium sp. AG-Ba]|nr:hypothetical protein RhiJN_16168 [Ceratobasidium sp. AG-Ba]QRV88151.1 hypothetical protein RhiJN_16169 [Ceratobasidium sp. AG-Ba]
MAAPLQIANIEEAEEAVKSYYREEDGTFLVVHHKGPSLLGFGNELNFSWALGPITLKATVNTALLSISAVLGVTVPFIGFITLAHISGDLKKGIETGIDVFVAKGSARLYLDGKDLHLELRLDSTFFKSIQGDYKLITISGRK